jgi:polyisoprenoid-binding protein YceI
LPIAADGLARTAAKFAAFLKNIALACCVPRDGSGRLGSQIVLIVQSSKGDRMKTSIARIALIIVLIMAAPFAAFADTWQIDPAHTNVEFTVRHMMISNVSGQFEKTSGTITTDGGNPTSALIDATIDASSINTRVAKRDGHLKSPDFLDVAKYPTITFKSKKVEAAGAGKWKVTGDLTLHGVTKEVVLDVDGPTPPIKDPMGNMRAGASATTTISRKDFGLTWNKTMESGGVIVGDEVKISIDVEAVKKPGA